MVIWKFVKQGVVGIKRKRFGYFIKDLVIPIFMSLKALYPKMFSNLDPSMFKCEVCEWLKYHPMSSSPCK